MPRAKGEFTPAQRLALLKRVMARHRLSAAEVALYCDVSRDTVYSWTCGARNVPARALRLLAHELNARR